MTKHETCLIVYNDMGSVIEAACPKGKHIRGRLHALAQLLKKRAARMEECTTTTTAAGRTRYRCRPYKPGKAMRRW